MRAAALSLPFSLPFKNITFLGRLWLCVFICGIRTQQCHNWLLRYKLCNRTMISVFFFSLAVTHTYVSIDVCNRHQRCLESVDMSKAPFHRSIYFISSTTFLFLLFLAHTKNWQPVNWRVFSSQSLSLLFLPNRRLNSRFNQCTDVQLPIYQLFPEQLPQSFGHNNILIWNKEKLQQLMHCTHLEWL